MICWVHHCDFFLFPSCPCILIPGRVPLALPTWNLHQGLAESAMASARQPFVPSAPTGPWPPWPAWDADVVNDWICDHLWLEAVNFVVEVAILFLLTSHKEYAVSIRTHTQSYHMLLFLLPLPWQFLASRPSYQGHATWPLFAFDQACIHSTDLGLCM